MRNGWQKLFGVAPIVVCAGMAYAGSGSTCSASAATKGKDIVDTAVSAGSFKTLVTAVKAAGMVETLKGEGPLTVFAPTDEAFAKLPKGALEGLLADPSKLRAVLKYHVVSGKVMAADVVKVKQAKTVLGQSVKVSTKDGVKINDAKVVKTDIGCSNGVIHVVDTVLLPGDDVIDVARKAGSFKTLLKAIEAAGLTDALRSGGPFTVFAPTDDAFAKLPEGALDGLVKDPKKLKSVLTYHVVPKDLTAKDVAGLTSAKTLQGGALRISTTDGVRIDDSTVVNTDIRTANGVIHVIDSVLIPRDESARAE